MPKKITPEQLAASGSEDGHQLALMCWAADNFDKYPELKWLHHSPNGGSRDKREAGKFKAMGTKNGFPDLILLVKRGQFPAILIELKIPELIDKKNGGAQPEQMAWGNYLLDNGYGYRLCHGWEMARDTLISYLEWKG